MRVSHRYYIIFIGYWAFSDVNLQTSHVHSPNTQKMPLKIGQNWQDQPSWGVTQLKNGKCWPWFFACSTATYHILLDKNDGKIWADKCWTCQVQFWSAVDKVDPHNFPASDFANKLAAFQKIRTQCKRIMHVRKLLWQESCQWKSWRISVETEADIQTESGRINQNI